MKKGAGLNPYQREINELKEQLKTHKLIEEKESKSKLELKIKYDRKVAECNSLDINYKNSLI